MAKSRRGLSIDRHEKPVRIENEKIEQQLRNEGKLRVNVSELPTVIVSRGYLTLEEK